MNLTMLKGKIHRATVTQAALDYVGSITIDEDLWTIAGALLPCSRSKYIETQLRQYINSINDIEQLEREVEKEKQSIRAKEEKIKHLKEIRAINNKNKEVIFKAMECVDYDTKMKEYRRREKFRLYDKTIDIDFPEDYDYFSLDCSIFRIKNFDAVVASFGDVDMECLGVTRWVPCRMCLLDYYDDIKRLSVEEAKKEAEKR